MPHSGRVLMDPPCSQIQCTLAIIKDNTNYDRFQINFPCDQIKQLYHIKRRVVQYLSWFQACEEYDTLSISDENTDCSDFSQFFLRHKHQIHNSQHQVAKVKAKNGGGWEENTSKVCSYFWQIFLQSLALFSTVYKKKWCRVLLAIAMEVLPYPTIIFDQLK